MVNEINKIISFEKQIQQLLNNNFGNNFKVTNVSQQHKKHLDNFTNDSHFIIEISKQYFKGISRLHAHKKINQTLQQLFKDGLHSVSIKLV